MQLSEDGFKRALRAALRYLGYRDRSVHEMRDYLAGKDFSPLEVSKTLDYLIESNYLNDARFAEQFARSRLEAKRFGRFRLHRELQSKGIEEALVDRVLSGLFQEVDAMDLARACAEKRQSALVGLPPQTARRRLAQFLGRKGFAADTVYRVVDEMLS